MFTKSVIKKIEVIAGKLGVEPAALLAVAEVESAGVDIWMVRGNPMPPIRFEGHYFYKRLKGTARARAISAGLANPKAGAVKNPRSYSARYDLYKRAEATSPQAAFESSSWGVGQVMGAHWHKLGFASWTAMYNKAVSGVDGQVDIMARYIQKFGLVDELQEHGWKSFADQYNGPASAKNNYAAKIKSAYNRWLAADRVDPRIEAVKGWQTDLRTLGYDVGIIDGKAGRKTKAAVRKFQKDQGLVDDGKIGQMTIEAIADEIRKGEKKGAETYAKVGTSTASAGALGQVAMEQAQSLQVIGSESHTIQIIIAVVTILGLALTAFGLYSRFKRDRDSE